MKIHRPFQIGIEVYQLAKLRILCASETNNCVSITLELNNRELINDTVYFCQRKDHDRPGLTSLRVFAVATL